MISTLSVLTLPSSGRSALGERPLVGCFVVGVVKLFGVVDIVDDAEKHEIPNETPEERMKRINREYQAKYREKIRTGFIENAVDINCPNETPAEKYYRLRRESSARYRAKRKQELMEATEKNDGTEINTIYRDVTQNNE